MLPIQPMRYLNKDTGFLGENLAAEHLIRMGYNIVHRNWRYKHLEIDIIASKINYLHIVEVKTRRTNKFGFPEERIDRQKMQYLKNAAAIFQYQNPIWKSIQFDVIAIQLNPANDWEIYLIEDVYF